MIWVDDTGYVLCSKRLGIPRMCSNRFFASDSLKPMVPLARGRGFRRVLDKRAGSNNQMGQNRFAGINRRKKSDRS